jgi:hypothetical protein
MHIGSNVKWMKHFECIIPNLHCMLCYVGVTSLMKTCTLKSVYITYRIYSLQCYTALLRGEIQQTMIKVSERKSLEQWQVVRGGSVVENHSGCLIHCHVQEHFYCLYYNLLWKV